MGPDQGADYERVDPVAAATHTAGEATGVRPSSPPARLLALQRVAGNRAVAQLLQGAVLQRQLAQPVGMTGAVSSALTGYPHLGTPDPTAVPADPAGTYRTLRGQVIAARDEQRLVAASLKGDMKYWFAKVYSYVTENIVKAADAGRFMYPIVVFQWALAFHATYRDNLSAWRAGNRAKVEPNWKIAFAEAESVNSGSWYRTRSQQILSALLPAMEAHIRFDLPRAIAAVFEAQYAATGAAFNTFKGDYDRFGPIFETATVQIQPEIDAECSVFDPGDWHALQDFGFPAFFNIPVERQHSWEKAEEIVSGHAGGIHTQAGMEARLEAYSQGAHPGSGADDFKVSTSWGAGEWAAKKVADYDWNTQPP